MKSCSILAHSAWKCEAQFSTTHLIATPFANYITKFHGGEFDHEGLRNIKKLKSTFTTKAALPAEANLGDVLEALDVRLLLVVFEVDLLGPQDAGHMDPDELGPGLGAGQRLQATRQLMLQFLEVVVESVEVHLLVQGRDVQLALLHDPVELTVFLKKELVLQHLLSAVLRLLHRAAGQGTQRAVHAVPVLLELSAELADPVIYVK